MTEQKIAYQKKLELATPIALKILESRTASSEDLKALRDVEAVENTTDFRSSSLFPGERYIVQFNSKDEERQLGGWLGFDDSGKLISIQTVSQPLEALGKYGTNQEIGRVEKDYYKQNGEWTELDS